MCLSVCVLDSYTNRRVLVLSLAMNAFIGRVSSSCLLLFQAEDGIRYLGRSRGLGDVYKRQSLKRAMTRPKPKKNGSAARSDGGSAPGEPAKWL